MRTLPPSSESNRGGASAAKGIGIALAASLVAVALFLLFRPAPEVEIVPDEIAKETPSSVRLGGRGPLDGTAREVPFPVPTPSSHPGYTLPDELRFDAYPLLGHTRFQHRLSTGIYLLALRDALTETAPDPAAVHTEIGRAAEVGMLTLDAYAKVLRETRLKRDPLEVAKTLLQRLTDPGRDPTSLRLSTLEENESPVGEGALLRIWTQGMGYPKGEVAAGEALLLELNRFGGDPAPDGYDVLATPGMGEEVFPDWGVYRFLRYAAGFHSPADEICCIRSTYPTAFRTRLLQHELLHAWAHQAAPEWGSRFLEEGLAEYVSFLRRNDPGLDVPTDRFRDQFAALLVTLRRLESSGAHAGGLSFSALIGANPGEFYAMGSFGYLLALACVAKAGGEAVEQAIGGRSLQPLAEVIRELSWNELMAFVHEHARGGDAARATVFSDAGVHRDPRDDADDRNQRRTKERLEALGFTIRDGYPDWLLNADLDLPADVSPQSRDRLRDVLSRMEESDVRLYATDATTSLTEPFAVAEASLLGETTEPMRTRAEFAGVLLTPWLAEAGPDAPGLVAWNETTRPTALPVAPSGEILGFWALLRWLRRIDAKGKVALTVLVGSETDARRSTVAQYRQSKEAPLTDADHAVIDRIVRAILLDRLRLLDRDLSTVLVVDLADGEGDAHAIADAFAAYLGAGGAVAYWNPQQYLR